MKNEIEAMITDITATTAEAEDYTGEDGLLYCGKCHTPKEAYFAEGKTCFGRDPVSYTHLDVYKRQLFSFPSLFVSLQFLQLSFCYL